MATTAPATADRPMIPSALRRVPAPPTRALDPYSATGPRSEHATQAEVGAEAQPCLEMAARREAGRQEAQESPRGCQLRRSAPIP
jgi:hypothetical protein